MAVDASVLCGEKTRSRVAVCALLQWVAAQNANGGDAAAMRIGCRGVGTTSCDGRGR